MRGDSTYRIFVSAVTPEFGKARADVAAWLRRKGLEVRDQEHFRQGPGTLLEKLEDYIITCDAVIFIVGNRAGAFPAPDQSAQFEAYPEWQEYAAASGATRASYTQWELLFTRRNDKKAYVFFGADGFEPDTPNNEAPADLACQEAYRAFIKQTGKDRSTFKGTDDLLKQILVLPFPDRSKPKPIHLPYRSIGTLFKGRDAFLRDLRASLEASSANHRASAVVNAVHGLGGVGKTRAAVEYAWAHQDDYSALLFVAADDPAKLTTSLAGLAVILDLPEKEAREDQVRLQAALDWLQKNPGWLMILDNVDTSDAATAVEGALASLLSGHVLITSRIDQWSGQVEPLRLGVLKPEDAVAFLLARTEGRRRPAPDDAEQAKALAETLGHLSLMLEQAGAYIAERRMTVAAYRTAWDAKRDELLSWYDERTMQYPRAVAVTWATSVAQLSPAAKDLLDQLAWFAPDPIPESLLTSKGAPPNADESLAELARYSLAERDAARPELTVHRLVQEVTRRRLGINPAPPALTAALNWIDAAFVGDPSDVRTWPMLDPLLTHAVVFGGYGDNRKTAGPVSRLLNQCAVLHVAKGRYAEAEPLHLRAMAIAERHLGDAIVAIILGNLANLFHYTNRSSEAESAMRRALAIGESVHGKDHPSVAIALNNLAQMLHETGRYSEAEPLMRKALAIDEEALGPLHPNVAIRLNNLSLTLKETDRVREAESLVRRAVSIHEKHFGNDHPNVAISLNNLAGILMQTDRLEEGERMISRALSILAMALGVEHPHTKRGEINARDLLADCGHSPDDIYRIIADCLAGKP